MDIGPLITEGSPGVIRLKTKAGSQTVGDNCNVTYGIKVDGPLDRANPILSIELDHRSEDIEAWAALKLTPEQARELSEILKQSADKAERLDES